MLLTELGSLFDKRRDAIGWKSGCVAALFPLLLTLAIEFIVTQELIHHCCPMKYSYVAQHNQEDCGAACLATIAKFYRCTLSLNRVREAVGTGQTGTTLLGLKRGAAALGFKARSVKASPEILLHLSKIPLPAIIHWQGYHWVVLYQQQGKHYVIADPATGIRRLSHQELLSGWLDWTMLLLEPDIDRLTAQSEPQSSSVQRFLTRVGRYRALLMQVLLLNGILGLLSLASPFLMQILTDDVLVRGDGELLTTMAIAVSLMTLVSSSLRLVQSHLIANFAQRLELGLMLEFGRQILRLPLTYYELRRSGEIVSRLQDVREINQFVSQVAIGLPSQFFIALVSLGLMLFYSWKLSIAALGFAIVMTLSTIGFMPALQAKTRKVLVVEAENQGVLVETFKGAMTLKTTTAIPQFWDELQSRFSRLANLTYSTMQIGIINSTFSGLVSGLGGIALLWFGGQLVMNPMENLSIGQLLAFKAMTDNFLGFISTVIQFVDEFARTKTATQRLSEVIEATAEHDIEPEKATVPISAQAAIVCSQIHFHYPGRVELLEDFSLTMALLHESKKVRLGLEVTSH